MERIAGDTAALEAWSGVLTKARTDLQDTTIVMWFADVEPMTLEDQVLTLSVPSVLVRERLQHNHLGLIEDAAADVCGHPVKIEFIVDEGMRLPMSDSPEPVASEPSPVRTNETSPTPTNVHLGAPGLPFPNYTFDAFVPGA